MTKTKTDIEKVVEFCNKHADAAKATRTPHETDVDRASRLAEESAYRFVISFIKNNNLK